MSPGESSDSGSFSPGEAGFPRPGYCVVLFSLPDDPHEMRDMLVKTLGLHPSDAQIAVRSSPGVLPMRLEQAQAAALVSSAAELGVAAAALPESEVPDFEHGEIVHHLRCVEEGIEVIDFHGRSTDLVPWSCLRVMSIGHVSGERTSDFLVEPSATSGLAPRLRFPPTDSAVHTGLEAWLVRGNPWAGLRINANQMNYEYLGDRKTDSASKNFGMFIADVLHRTPLIYLTPASRAFLEHSLVRHYEFHSADELRRYTQFHAILAQQTAGRK